MAAARVDFAREAYLGLEMECNLLRTGIFNARHAGDFGLRRGVVQGCAENLCNFKKFHVGQ